MPGAIRAKAILVAEGQRRAYRRRVRAFLVTLAACALAPSAARATYSMCATDTAARQVGGAGTSCVAPSSVYVIYGSAPGHGVVHAQALYHEPGKLEAVNRLWMDEPPADIIAAITDTAFDPLSLPRQYGIADLMGRTAGFTGMGTMAYAEDRQGIAGTFPYSVRGNILTSVAVIDQAEDAFVDGGGCDLADRLMLALEAGANGGEGDSRCTPSGIPSDAAFIEVDREGEPAQAFLYLEVQNTAPQNPIVLLRAQYDVWRMSHPCPPMPDGGMPDAGADGPLPPDAGADAAADAGTPDVAVPDAGVPLDAPVPPDAGADTAQPPADVRADASVATDVAADPLVDVQGPEPVDAAARADARTPDAPSSADARSPDGAGDLGDDAAGGCACRAGGAGTGPWFIWPLVWAWRRRRSGARR